MLHGYRQGRSLCESEDIYVDLVGDTENKFDTSNNEVERPLPMSENKKVTELTKDKLDG